MTAGKSVLAAVLLVAMLPLSGCLTYTPWSPCLAEKPAYELTDQTLAEYNAKRPVGVVVPYPDGWHHSTWTDRRVVTCKSDEAYVRALGVHHRSDGSELARIDARYMIARKDGRWIIASRTAGAP